jgi:hypothetical protein
MFYGIALKYFKLEDMGGDGGRTARLRFGGCFFSSAPVREGLG